MKKILFISIGLFMFLPFQVGAQQSRFFYNSALPGMVSENNLRVFFLETRGMSQIEAPESVEVYINDVNVGSAPPTYEVDRGGFQIVFEDVGCAQMPMVEYFEVSGEGYWGYSRDSIRYVAYYADGTSMEDEAHLFIRLVDGEIFIRDTGGANFVEDEETAVRICGGDREPLYDVVDHTFETYIRNLYNDEIISGYSDGSFRPDEPVTREAVAKFIKLAYDIETNTGCEEFPDVDDSNVFYEYITSLKCEGIVDGYSDGGYHPSEIVTRAQATKMVINAARAKTGDDNFFSSAVDDVFPDVPRDNVYYEYIMSAFSNNIVDGQSDGNFNPDGLMTRGATAKVIDISREQL